MVAKQGYCYEIEHVYKRFQLMDQKNLVLLEHMFNSFWRHFHVLILKRHVFLAIPHLTVAANDELQLLIYQHR
jgi:hypothetical protein